jgi:hypothetical protein
MFVNLIGFPHFEHGSLVNRIKDMMTSFRAQNEMTILWVFGPIGIDTHVKN